MTTILLLEEDDKTRRLLVDNLRDRGYKVIVTVDLENAIDWLSSTLTSPDIFLINQVNTSVAEYLVTVNYIQQQSEFTLKLHTVILAEKYEAYLKGHTAKLDRNQYILYLEDAEQLFDFLHHLDLDDDSQND